MSSVLMIGSEALPFSKTGGLADVLGALPRALARLGWDVTVVIPRHRGSEGGMPIERFPIAVGGYTADVRFLEAPLEDGATVVLVDVPELYDRDNLYVAADGLDYPDNPRRFAVLVRAALEFAARRGEPPAIIHGHDWQAGLAPVYLKTLYAGHPMLSDVSTVFTIHNLAYQGNFPADWLPRLDLPWDLLAIDRLEFWGQISFLKGGINDSDLVTTVSPTYADEIQTSEFGCGFEGILRRRADRLIGVLNGIDEQRWDPANDSYLPAPFSIDDLAAKRESKTRVLAEYGLPASGTDVARPLVAMISRMVDQKGLDLIEAVADQLPLLDASFVVLGTGEARYEEMWRRLSSAAPNRIGARIGFDEGLAHLIEAGADIFLMPSQFEPCGLNQMYSLRYGTVPVVRAVGGLADTVEDGKNGFAFVEYTPEGLLSALQRALDAYKNRRKWRALQRAGMKADHSWDHSAREYVKIYERLLGPKEAHGG